MQAIASDNVPTDITRLDAYLINAERDIRDLQAGTEKSIRWYQGKPVERDVAFVYLHGFSASRQEISPVTEQLADRFGANVYYTRLAGHGRDADAMAEPTLQDWKNDVREALLIGQRIGKHVVFISASTGATLTTWLLGNIENNKSIVASIQVSPNYAIKSSLARAMRFDWAMSLAKWINGDYHSFEPASELQKKFWTERYPVDAMKPMLTLVDEVDRLDKSNITAAQLIIYSSEDRVVDAKKSLRTAREFTGAQVTTREFTQSRSKSQHVLAGAATAPEAVKPMVNLMADFLTPLLANID